jgi:hypothetical protein
LANVIIPYELGGSRSRGSVPAASTWVDVEEFNDIVVDGSNSLQKFIVVQRRTDDAGTSVNTRLVDRDNSDAVIWTGTAATSTSWAFDTRTLITLNASATHRYVLQVWRNNAIAAVYAKGRIEEVVTS